MRLHTFAVLGLLACRTPLPSPREAALRPLIPELARIDDGKAWSVINAESSSASLEEGKTVLRLSPRGGNMKGSNVAMALVQGLEFAEGTIEVDLKGNGDAQASFLGVAFGISDGRTYEAVYFRPFNF
jgi:hypothetical protein